MALDFFVRFDNGQTMSIQEARHLTRMPPYRSAQVCGQFGPLSDVVRTNDDLQHAIDIADEGSEALDFEG